MSRITAVSPQDAGPIVKIGYRMARKQVGEVPEPFAVLAHHRKLFVASARHELALRKAMHVVPDALIQLAVYRTAWTVGCSWCVDFGAMLMRLDELDVDRLKEIADFETSDKFTEADREVIRYADAMTATPMSVTDEQVAALRGDVRRGRRSRADLPDLAREPASANEPRARHHRSGLWLRRLLSRALGYRVAGQPSILTPACFSGLAMS